MALPLSDVRILDLSRLLPGPYATLLLADLGAQVDKLEDPNGDGTRQMGPSVGGESALYLALNRNKRSLVLDLKKPQGVAALKRLVKQYDVLVESFRPGVMEKLGVSYEVLKQENPKLIYCAITGYGQTGPDRLKAGHDLNYVARSGVLGYGGDPAAPPVMPGVQVADIGGALVAVSGILAALHAQRMTGEGRLVDVAMNEASMAFLHLHLGGRLMAGEAGSPLQRGREALNGGLPCYGVYATKDGRGLAVGALEPKFFAGLLAKLDRMDLMEEAYQLGAGADRVRAALAELFRQKPLSEWQAFFAGTDFCVEPVLEGDEVLADAQLNARGMFVTAKDEARGVTLTHLRTPLHLGELPVEPAPSLGRDTRAVLAEAGFTEDEVNGLLV
jgi:crotonobetainyl-CoA:carnitine CoA-transferase CaiB-like acyl-CoA transferase